jgi:hypothetical protein
MHGSCIPLFGTSMVSETELCSHFVDPFLSGLFYNPDIVPYHAE